MYSTEQRGPENPVGHWHEKPLGELSGTQVAVLLQGLEGVHFESLNEVKHKLITKKSWQI